MRHPFCGTLLGSSPQIVGRKVELMFSASLRLKAELLLLLVLEDQKGQVGIRREVVIGLDCDVKTQNPKTGAAFELAADSESGGALGKPPERRHTL